MTVGQPFFIAGLVGEEGQKTWPLAKKEETV
jgi:hypothetical protein